MVEQKNPMRLQQGLVIFFPNKDINYLSPLASAYTLRNVKFMNYLQTSWNSKFKKHSKGSAPQQRNQNRFQRILKASILLLL